VEKRSTKERAPKKGREHKPTERKRAKEALLENKELYEYLADTLPDPVVILQDDRYQFVNPAFTRVFGYTRQDLDRGLSFLETIQEHDKRAARQRYKDRLAGKQLSKINTIDLIAKDGTLVPCETSATMVQYRGRLADLVIMRDITECKRSEKALRESEEFSSSLLSNSPHPIIVINPDTSVRYVNPALEKLTGFTSAELMGRKAPYPWWTEETLQKTEKDFAKAIREGAQRLEELFQTKDGERCWVEITSAAIKSDGKLKYYLSNWVDITERKRAEEALWESEERYKDIVENAGIAICVDDENGNVTYFNQEFAGLFGYSIEEMKKQSHKTLLHPDDVQIISEFHKRHVQGEKEPSRYEFRGLKKDGSVIHLEVVIGSILTEGSSITGIRNYFWDVTERTRAEEALRDSEKRFRTIVETAPSLLIITDAKGKNIYVSPNCEEITSYTQEELLGKVRWWVHEDDTPRAREAFERAIREGVGATNFEYKAVKKNGQVWYASSSWEPLKEEDGKLKGIVLQTIDITERTRAEEALRESEEKFRTMLSSSPDAITLSDLNGVVIESNQAALHTHGFSSKEEAIGQQSLDYIAPQDRPRAIENVKKTLEQGTVRDVEYTFLTKDGREFPGELSASLIRDSDGEPAFFIGITRDITERKRAEEALRKTTEELRAEREELAEMNLVFKHILEHIEEERQEYKQQICQDVEQVVTAILARLQEKVGPSQTDTIEALQENLKVILAKDIDVFRERYAKLTPRELEICDMIREGLSSKEIAKSLNLSLLTVHKHREDIRKKLGITNKNVNLGTYLQVR